jgi:hypothetical protein
MELFKFIFSNVFIWLGFMILIITIGKITFSFYQRTLRHFIMLKYGYPPNCDADGDLPDLSVDNKEDDDD